MYRDKVIAVVVPAFNEEVLIQETLLGIPDFVDRVYVINDGSRDGTGERIREVASKDGRIVLINHEINKGVGAAIVTGYARSLKDGMDITAVMAGDNQMDPLELPKLLDPVVDGEADYSKGNRLRSRDTAKGMSSWRYFGNNLLTYMTRIAAGNARISDPQNGYTAISNHVFKTMRPESIFTWYGYCNDMLVKLSAYGFVIRDVEIPARYGRERSGISYPKYIYRISRLLFNELMWRLNHQNLHSSPWKAYGVMAIGGGMFMLGAFGALLALNMPLAGLTMTESRVGVLVIMALAGLTISQLGYAVKTGDRFGTGERKI
jgi:glycosyltransferase involved in cell wall biosynthesis